MLVSISFDHLSRSFPFVGNVVNPKVWLRKKLLNNVTLWKHALRLKVKNELLCIEGGRRQALTVFLA